MSWCKCFVCGTVISLALPTGEAETRSFCLPENGTEMGEFLKIHLRAFFAPSLFLCPMAATEIERERVEKAARGGGGGGGGWVCLSSHALGKQI